MREEDEIRAAVTALAAAVERGENVEGELPSPELLAEVAASRAETAPATPEEAQEQMLAAVFAAVRTATRESRLSRPADWEAQGLVPEGLTAEDVEMAVYERMAAYLAAEGEGEAVALPNGAVGAGAGALTSEAVGGVTGRRPVNKHVNSLFSSSNGRAVGAPAFKRHKAAEAVAAAPQEAAGAGFEKRAGAEESSGSDDPDGSGSSGDLAGSDGFASSGDLAGPAGSDGCASSDDSTGPNDSIGSDDSAGSDDSIGSSGPFPADEFADCRGIRLLMGASSYYLYDRTAMTDAYARWAFLAAEDDPVTTFLECVREESSVYPRPMAITTLANEPFRMDAAAVEAAFMAAHDQGRAEDVERVEASNGDAYFYSTRFLTPRRAKALAEWDAVERFRNV